MAIVPRPHDNGESLARPWVDVPSRRGPRWVVWPAKLLWVPVLLSGLWFTLAIEWDATKVDDGTWRVLATVPSPAQWLDEPVAFGTGIALLVLGTALAAFYLWRPGTGRRLTAIEYPLFSWAAWLFLAIAVLATFRLEEPLVEAGRDGVDWRFLAHLRTTALDRSLAAASALAGALCWLLGWGFQSGRWVRSEAHPRQHEQQRRAQEDVRHPAGQ